MCGNIRMLVDFFLLSDVSTSRTRSNLKSRFKVKIELNEYLDISNWRKNNELIKISHWNEYNLKGQCPFIENKYKTIRFKSHNYFLLSFEIFLLFCCFMLIFLLSNNGRKLWKKYHFKNLFGRDYLKLNTLRYPHQRIVKIDDLRGDWVYTQAKLPGKYIKN